MFTGNRARCRMCWKPFCCLEHRRKHELVTHCGFHNLGKTSEEEKNRFRSHRLSVTPSSAWETALSPTQIELDRNAAQQKIIVPVHSFRREPKLPTVKENSEGEAAVKETRNATFNVPEFASTPVERSTETLAYGNSKGRKRKVISCERDTSSSPGFETALISPWEGDSYRDETTESFVTPIASPIHGFFLNVADKLRTVFHHFPRWEREGEAKEKSFVLVGSPLRKRRRLSAAPDLLDTSFELSLRIHPIKCRQPLPSYQNRKYLG